MFLLCFCALSTKQGGYVCATDLYYYYYYISYVYNLYSLYQVSFNVSN